MKGVTDGETAGTRRVIATVTVGVAGRTHALDLMRALLPFRSYLVQHEQDRWVVHGRVPGGRGESLDDLLTAVEQWRSENGLTDITCLVDGDPARRAELSESRR